MSTTACDDENEPYSSAGMRRSRWLMNHETVDVELEMMNFDLIQTFLNRTWFLWQGLDNSACTAAPVVHGPCRRCYSLLSVRRQNICPAMEEVLLAVVRL